MTFAPDPSDFPEWLTTALTLLLGGGGLRAIQAILESRRLRDKDIRETMTSRIAALEERDDVREKEVQGLRDELTRTKLLLDIERAKRDRRSTDENEGRS